MFDLKRFRIFNGLTQVKLAQYFGVTQAYISQIERGLLELPEEYISKIKVEGLYVIPNEESREYSQKSDNRDSFLKEATQPYGSFATITGDEEKALLIASIQKMTETADRNSKTLEKIVDYLVFKEGNNNEEKE